MICDRREKESWISFAIGIVCGAGLAMILISTPYGVKTQFESLQKQAIEKGYAELIPDPADNKITKWQWKQTPEKQDK